MVTINVSQKLQKNKENPTTRDQSVRDKNLAGSSGMREE